VHPAPVALQGRLIRKYKVAKVTVRPLRVNVQVLGKLILVGQSHSADGTGKRLPGPPLITPEVNFMNRLGCILINQTLLCQFSVCNKKPFLA
jgi:hypothetical protein